MRSTTVEVQCTIYRDEGSAGGLVVGKTCTKCGEVKPLEWFPPDNRKRDGRQARCRACDNTRRAAAYAADREEIIAQRRATYAADPDGERRKKRAYYAANAEVLRERDGVRRAANAEGVKAVRVVNHAIRAGKLVRPEVCSRCGSLCKPDGHHADYSRPLEVVWLCRSCHRRHHIELRRQEEDRLAFRAKAAAWMRRPS